ncbi:MAG TPA: hypothetical protein ENK82_09240 [Campylobacterales bacterium]|nr:hypothetical protein [Campylobacterales bacterium]HHS93522.1 hypothetical protein [Campylobacterales bacterium]
MLTLYSPDSSFKKKLTVVVIWMVALSLGILLVDMVINHESSFLLKGVMLLIGLFMIAGILLRCKIARGVTLTLLYALALFPLVTNIITGSSVMMLSSQSNELFTSVEILLTNIIWAFLFAIPIYFFSNNKSMDIFFIERNPIEHLFFIAGAILVIFAYIMMFL